MELRGSCPLQTGPMTFALPQSPPLPIVVRNSNSPPPIIHGAGVVPVAIEYATLGEACVKIPLALNESVLTEYSKHILISICINTKFTEKIMEDRAVHKMGYILLLFTLTFNLHLDFFHKPCEMVSTKR